MTIPCDYYEILGVPRDADTTTIKDAFRKLARRYHPDISTEPDAEQRFKEIAEAYGVLSDPAKRASYDAQGSAGLAGATAEDLWGGIDFGDIFGPGAGAFGSLFERLFGPSAAGTQSGGDVHLDLAISLEEVLTGEGRGLPRYGGHGRGSLNLTVILDIPRQLSSRQKQLYEQLRAEGAGITSTVGRSNEPNAPPSAGRMTADTAGRPAGGRGLLVFASVLLLVTGVFNLVDGIAAIAGSHILIANAHYLSGGLRAWGCVMTILSAGQLVLAAGVWAGSQLARWLAVATVGLSAIGQTLSIPAYPLWSLMIIAADVVALWGLYAYGTSENLATGPLSSPRRCHL